MLNPQIALSDLIQYLQNFEIKLSQGAKDVISTIEQIGFENNRTIYPWTFLAGLLKAYSPLRAVIIRLGGNPQQAYDHAIARVRCPDDSYQDVEGVTPYSDTEYKRGITERTKVIDLAISIARRNRRNEITDADILEATIAAHDEDYPASDNYIWTDESLHTPYNTLAHIVGTYHSSLWVKHSDIQRELGLIGSLDSSLSPAETAPPEVRSAVLMLLDEHPEFARNCFLIMPFRETPVHIAIQSAVREILAEAGFNVLRADDRVYSEDLFTNIQAYMHACRFGVAVFERTLSEDSNPNVNIEVGYMIGQGKPVMLLKEQTIRQLPSDLIGRLYVPFNGMQIHDSLKPGITKWLSDRRLA